MAEDIKWQDPPPSKRVYRHEHWQTVFAALRQRPGTWALVEEGANAGTGSLIKNGRYSGTEAGEFDAVVRSRPDGKFDVYARYVGGEVSS